MPAVYKAREVNFGWAPHAKILAELHTALFPGITFPSDGGFWWLVWRGREAVAFSYMCGSTWFPSTGYFARVGVLKSHRGHGLQRRLMNAAERKARSLKWEAIVSDTNEVPRSAANFEALGYTQFTPEKPWAATKALYWRKDLT